MITSLGVYALNACRDELVTSLYFFRVSDSLSSFGDFFVFTWHMGKASTLTHTHTYVHSFYLPECSTHPPTETLITDASPMLSGAAELGNVIFISLYGNVACVRLTHFFFSILGVYFIRWFLLWYVLVHADMTWWYDQVTLITSGSGVWWCYLGCNNTATGGPFSDCEHESRELNSSRLMAKHRGVQNHFSSWWKPTFLKLCLQSRFLFL